MTVPDDQPYKPSTPAAPASSCARRHPIPIWPAAVGVARSTIDLWIASHPDVQRGVQQGPRRRRLLAVESRSRAVTGYTTRREGPFSMRGGSPGRETYTASSPSNQGLHVLAAQRRRRTAGDQRKRAMIEQAQQEATDADLAGSDGEARRPAALRKEMRRRARGQA